MYPGRAPAKVLCAVLWSGARREPLGYGVAVDLEGIIAAAKDGDAAAQKYLAIMLNGWLKPFIAHLVRGSSLEAEDISQKVFMVVLEHLPRFEYRGPESLDRWVREIARRRVLEGWRGQAKEAVDLAQFAQHPQAVVLTPVSLVTLQELQEQLGVVFDELTDLQREAILLDWVAQDAARSDADLAQLHGTTVNAIQVSRSRGLKKLATETQKMRKTPLPLLEPRPESSTSSSEKTA